MSQTISRRKFLKLSALSALALASVRTARADDSLNIVVIGAGIAGLAAARKLQAAGHTVAILEARNRIGGRIFTSRDIGAPIDLGAGWIHGAEDSDHPTVRLAREASAEFVETDFDAVQVFEKDGEELDFDAAADANERIRSRLFSRKAQLQGGGRDVSTASVLDALLADSGLEDSVQRLIHWSIRTDFGVELGVDLDWLSLRYLDEDLKYGDVESVFPRGYGQLTDFLARGLNVQTGTVVRSIELAGDGVKIDSNRGALAADRVIVTAPLGVLKANRIQFKPGLSEEKQRAIQALGVGALEKIVLRFPRQFWPEETFQFGYAPWRGERPAIHEFYNYAPVANLPILVGLGAGEQGRALQRDPRAAAAGMLQILKEIFGNSIPAPVGQQASAWTSDPFSLGSYSYVATGASLAQCETLAKPIEDRIFFAGEHTSAKYPGTTHGALLSGLRAADAI